MLTQLLLAVSYCACPTQPDMRSGQCAVSAWHRPAGTPKQNVWSGFTLVSQSVSCCHAGKCSLVFSKDLLIKYIVFCASNLSGYLTHVVEWTGAIWPSSSLRAAVVVPRILQAEKLDSCQMNLKTVSSYHDKSNLNRLLGYSSWPYNKYNDIHQNLTLHYKTAW